MGKKMQKEGILMANKEGGRKRLLAILDILKKHSDAEIHMTSEDIRKKLIEDYEIEADRRSIRTDVKALIEFELVEDAPNCAKRDDRGCFYCGQAFDDWELKMMIDGIAQTGYFKAETLNRIIDQVADLSGPSSRQLLTENRPVLETEIDDSDFYLSLNLDALMGAIKQRKQVRFQYFKLDEKKHPAQTGEGTHVVNPYVITKRGFFYYLVTYKDGDQFIRPFRIDRIRNVKVLDEKRMPPERLPIGDMTAELKAYRKNNTDSFTGQSTSVEVLWEDEPSVLYDVFGLSNVEFVRADKDGSGRVFVIKAQKNQGLYHNLLRLGSKLTVLGPAAVKDAYVAMVREICGKY